MNIEKQLQIFSQTKIEKIEKKIPPKNFAQSQTMTKKWVLGCFR